MKTITDPQSESSYTLSQVTYVDNDVPEEVDRINQQQILPGAISNRFLNNLISSSNTTNTPFVVANGTSTTLICTLVDNFNRIILAIPQISIYIGISDPMQATAANTWPTAAIGGGNFPVYFNPFSYQGVTGNNQVARVTCRNNSGADQQVLATVQWKLITVPSKTTNNSTGFN